MCIEYIEIFHQVWQSQVHRNQTFKGTKVSKKTPRSQSINQSPQAALMMLTKPPSSKIRSWNTFQPLSPFPSNVFPIKSHIHPSSLNGTQTWKTHHFQVPFVQLWGGDTGCTLPPIAPWWPVENGCISNSKVIVHHDSGRLEELGNFFESPSFLHIGYTFHQLNLSDRYVDPLDVGGVVIPFTPTISHRQGSCNNTLNSSQLTRPSPGR